MGQSSLFRHIGPTTGIIYLIGVIYRFSGPNCAGRAGNYLLAGLMFKFSDSMGFIPLNWPHLPGFRSISSDIGENSPDLWATPLIHCNFTHMCKVFPVRCCITLVNS